MKVAAQQSDAAVRQELGRILASPEFAQADRLSALLRYVVETTLDGRGDHVKESVIGVQVFGRKIGYDPKLDGVVRVSAGRLRARLLKYYEREQGSTIRIEIPKGSYVPEFRTAGAEVPVVTPESPVVPNGFERTGAEIPQPAAVPVRSGKLGIAVAAGVALVLIALAAVYLSSTRRTDLRELVLAGAPFNQLPGMPNRPSFSPDGKTLAFDWDGPNSAPRDIYVQGLTAESPIRLTTDPSMEVWPVWSPDGSRIAFTRLLDDSTFAIVVMPFPGTGERVIARLRRSRDDAPRVDWSRDGAWFVTAERPEDGGMSRIVLISATDGAMRPLTVPPAGTRGDSEAAFSPDGRSVAFRRTVANMVEDVYVVPVAGGAPRRITHDNRGISALTWSHDGASLVVATRRSGSIRQLWEFPINGGEPVRVTPPTINASSPSLSRQGDQLTFVQVITDFNLYEVDTALSNPPRRVHAANVNDLGPTMSPDGRKIAFRTMRTGSDEIWVSDRDGTNPRRLVKSNGSTTNNPAWSPDGRSIAYDSRPNGKSDIFVVDADGSHLRQVTDDPASDSLPSWSSDGKWLYFASERGGKSEIWKQPADGSGKPARVTDTGGTAVWALESLDGKTLHYTTSGANSSLWVLDLESGGTPRGTPHRMSAVDPYHVAAMAVAPQGLFFLGIGNDAERRLKLKLLSARTGTVTEIGDLGVRNGRFGYTFTASRDGSSILFPMLDRSGHVLVVGRAR
jgi:Tol biopolymer transport system component